MCVYICILLKVRMPFESSGICDSVTLHIWISLKESHQTLQSSLVHTCQMFCLRGGGRGKNTYRELRLSQPKRMDKPNRYVYFENSSKTGRVARAQDSYEFCKPCSWCSLPCVSFWFVHTKPTQCCLWKGLLLLPCFTQQASRLKEIILYSSSNWKKLPIKNG